MDRCEYSISCSADFLFLVAPASTALLARRLNHRSGFVHLELANPPDSLSEAVAEQPPPCTSPILSPRTVSVVSEEQAGLLLLDDRPPGVKQAKTAHGVHLQEPLEDF